VWRCQWRDDSEEDDGGNDSDDDNDGGGSDGDDDDGGGCRGNSQGRASLVLKVANALSVESGVFPYPVTDVINKNISGSPTNGEDGRSVRATDYPVGGAIRAAVLAIGRQTRTVYAFRTFPRVAAARPPAPRVPHYLPTSATDVVDDDDYAGEDGSGGYQHRGTTRRRRAESLRTVQLERTGDASGGFLLLPHRVCLLSL